MQGAPSSNCIRYQLEKLDELPTLEAQVNAALHSRMPPRIRKGRHRIAIDLHLIPDYGVPSETEAAYLAQTTARMLQLEPYHMISQEYVLPIPYVCQIYHLLNLKHLESVHGFSLNGLKVVEVSEFAATTIGGSIKFQTTLNSPLSPQAR